MKKLFIVLLSTLLTTMMLTACGDTEVTAGGKAVVRFMVGGSAGELELYEQAVDAFNEQSEDVKVEMIGLPGDNYNEKLLTQLSSRTPPDCFYSEEASYGELNNSDKLYDVTEFLNAGKYGLKKSDIPQSLIEFCTYNGKITGVPVDCNPMVIYYNVELFNKLGIKSPQEYVEEGTWNFASFQKVCEQLRDKGKIGFAYENWWGPMYSFLISRGDAIYSDDGTTSNFDNPRMQAGLTYLYDNIKSNAFIYAGSLTSGESPDSLFISGQVGMIYAGRWFVPDFKEISFTWDVVPFPYYEEPEDSISAMPSTPMVINKDTKNPEAVWKFVSFYCGSQGQELRLKDTGNAVPTVPNLDGIVLTGTPEHAQYFLDAKDIAITYPKIEAIHPGLTDALTEEVEKMLAGDQDVQTTLQNMKAVADSKLAE